MPSLREWITRLWWTFRPGRPDRELEQELRLHLELATEDEQRRANHSPNALRAAVIRHGSLEQTLESVRDQRGLRWLDDLTRDVRYALRMLRRNPLFASVTLLTLAISIGANTAVFTVVNSVLLRPLPYPESEELVAVRHSAPGAPGLSDVSGDLRLSPSMFFTYAEHNRTFQNIGVWTAGSATVTGVGEPEQLRVLFVTDGTLEALGVHPAIGRWLSTTDQQPGAPQVVMLTHGYWQRRFGGDPSIVGRQITMDAVARQIVGIMPQGFRVVDTEADMVAPLVFNRAGLTLPGFGFQGIARLKRGVTIDEASADVARMVPIWINSWPAAPGINPRVYEGFRIAPALRPLKQDVVGSVGNILWVLMGTIGIVLVIACANVANLLLVRGEARQQELAIRASLGAGRGRVVRGLLIESGAMGLLGGVLGLLLALLGVRALVAMGPEQLPRLAELSVDWRALVFTLVTSVLSGLVFGLVPALRYSGVHLSTALHAGGRSSSASRERRRVRDALVIAQVALICVLLVSSGLMIRTSMSLRAIEPGFSDPQSLQLVRIAIPATLIAEPERVARLQHDIVDRLLAIPGVSSAAFSTVMHMEGLGTPWDAIHAEGGATNGSELPPMRVFKSVSPGFFQTTGTRIVAGRDYTWTDLYDRRPFAIVSENLARELWGDPLLAPGKRVRALVPGSPWREVIGVVQDVHDNGVHKPPPAIVYWPSLGETIYPPGEPAIARAVTFAIRSGRAGSEALVNEVRQAIWSLNASLPLASVRTMKELYDRSMARTSFTLVMLAIVASMALILGLVGIAGVISYSVSQRRREIGIRLAVGAQQRDVKRMFVASGLALTGIGIVIGLAVAVGLTQTMASLLFGISPLDPATYLSVPIVLLTAATLASYLPVRRIAAIDPVEALKAE